MTYEITLDSTGEGPVTVAEIDNLADVLDDAVVDTAPSSDTADVAVSGVGDDDTFDMTGELASGDTATVTYTVTLRGTGRRGDNTATNFVVHDGETPPDSCVSGSPRCTTTPLPDVVDSKAVDPASLTTVVTGQELTYTLEFANEGQALGDVDRVDDLTHVLDDATLVSGPAPSDPTLTVSDVGNRDRFSVAGTLDPGATVQVTYTVRVQAAKHRGDDVLANFLLDPNQDPPEQPVCEDGDADCTVNPVGEVRAAKSVDPESGTKVKPGDRLTYTLTFDGVGSSAGRLNHVDRLDRVLDDAELVGGPTTHGDVDLTVDRVRSGALRISGQLESGQTATVTYSVQVRPWAEQGDHQLDNFLRPRGVSAAEKCVDADPLCTQNPVPGPLTSNAGNGPVGLPGTGAPPLLLALLLGGLLSLAAGAGILLPRGRVKSSS